MYNEAEVVGQVVSALREAFACVICVDDGSSDGSANVARAAGAVVVRHHHNLGAGAAIQTGIDYALSRSSTRYIVTFDADGQHRVSDAERLLDVARERGFDVVMGSRFLGLDPLGMTGSRRALLRGAVWFTRVTSGIRETDAHNGLRVLNRFAASKIQITINGMGHASEIVDQVAAHRLTWCEVPVTIDYTDYSRAKGQANINAVNISFELLGQRLRSGRRRYRTPSPR